MLTHANVMRAMAERYLRMAQMTSEPEQRTKFLDYASIYAQLSEQSEREESRAPVTDRARSQRT